MMNSKLPFCNLNLLKQNPSWHPRTVSSPVPLQLREWCSRAYSWGALPTCLVPEVDSKRQQSIGTSTVSLTPASIRSSSSLETSLLLTENIQVGRMYIMLNPSLGWLETLKVTQRSNIYWRIITEPWATGLLSLVLQSVATCLTKHVSGSFKPTQMNLFRMLYIGVALLP